MGTIQALVPRMREICGAGNVITDPLELRTYECDGLTAHRSIPALVVLPISAAEVAAVVTECARAKVPFVARGSGTGLSGGATPVRAVRRIPTRNASRRAVSQRSAGKSRRAYRCRAAEFPAGSRYAVAPPANS